MLTRRSTIPKGLFLFGFVIAFSCIASAQSAAPRITSAIDESRLATLAGGTRPEANTKNDRGPVPESFRLEHMFLQLRRSPEQERALDQYIEQLHDSNSPNFHHWLTAMEFGERYGLAQQDLTAITGWLQSRGFTVNLVYPNSTLIDFSGTAEQVRNVFHTGIHYLDVKGARHIANVRDPQIPAALAPLVVGVVSLNDFRPRPALTTSAPCDPSNPQPTQPSSCFSVVPADLATIYNFSPLFTQGISGQGQTIVVLEDSDVFSTADWTKFRSTLGLAGFTSGSFTQTNPAPPSGLSNCSDPGPTVDDGEAIIDAEWASAAAPSAAIQLASCASASLPGTAFPTFGALIALQNLINSKAQPPAVMSMSFESCEAENTLPSNVAYSSAYQQAVAEGVSVFVAAGDGGAALCDQVAGSLEATLGISVNGFASTQFNVAVGGTDFGDTFAGANSTYWNSSNTSAFGSAKSYIPEIPWNDSCASVLIATFVNGSGTTFGPNSVCNNFLGTSFLNTFGGGGGPSGCATGTPAAATPHVVSGTCAGYAKPSWQSVLGNPNDGVRDLPDVSLFAADAVWGHFYVACFSDILNGGNSCAGTPDTWTGVGGTSVAAPIVAGIQALANQKTGSRSGNPNPTYYSLAAAEYGASGNTSCNSSLGKSVAGSCIFYDVTQGDMDLPCQSVFGALSDCFQPSGAFGVLSTSHSAYQPAFASNTGWDFASGIGTINAANLVNNWPAAQIVGQFSLAPDPASINIATAGNAGLSAITVTGSGGFAGSVNLTCSVSPLPVNDPPVCFISPSSVALDTTTTSATANLRISTTARASTELRPENNPNRPSWFAASGGLALCCIFLLRVPNKRMRWATSLGLVVLIFLGVGFSSCGGGGGSSQINLGTPTGTYTVTVAASSGPAVQTTTVSLTLK
jgi:subtilase family serine protease